MLLAFDLADITMRQPREYARWIHEVQQPAYDPAQLIDLGRAGFTSLSTDTVDTLV